MIGQAVEIVPPYVAEYRRDLARVGRQHRWIIRHLLPAKQAVRTLANCLNRLLRREKERRSLVWPRAEVDWYAKYSPSTHMIVLDIEGRCRILAFLLKTLRVHAAALSNRQQFNRGPNDSRRRIDAESRLRHAPDALSTIGKWWIESNPLRRPYVTRVERRALALCVRVARLRMRLVPARDPKSLSRLTDKHARAMDWENRQWVKELQHGGR